MSDGTIYPLMITKPPKYVVNGLDLSERTTCTQNTYKNLLDTVTLMTLFYTKNLRYKPLTKNGITNPSLHRIKICQGKNV